MTTMIPSELQLACLRHCHIQLPESFVTPNFSKLKPGAIISVKSIQNDTELLVSWDGKVTSGSHTILDFNFAQANNFRDELIILSLANLVEVPECVSCRVQLLDNKDYNIVSQHLEANVLDYCQFVSVGLVIPIWLEQYVMVLVKVLDIQPGKDSGVLTKWTEMQFQHSLEDTPKQDEADEEDNSTILEPVEFVSCSLGLGYKLKFHLGAMLVTGEKGCGKTHYLKRILSNYKKYNGELFNCKHLRGKRPETISKRFSELLSHALEHQPSILALDDIDSFVSSDTKHDDDKGQEAIYRRRLADALCYMFKEMERLNHPKGQRVAIIASCLSLESLDKRLSNAKGRQYFNKIVKIKSPNLQERKDIFKSLIEEHKQIKLDISEEQLDTMARKTDSYMPLDLRRLVERSIINACSRSLLDFSTDPLIAIKEEDLSKSLDGYIRSSLRGVTLQQKTSKTFENVGGMFKIKDELKKTIFLPIKYPKLFKKFPIRPQTSILLYGPPGCGKTLIAEALTNQESINSICVRGPELLSKYIGASEAAVRNLFKQADLAQPCVIFFDEFESLVSKRGADSTGVTDRIVNQFLTLMDGVESLSEQIFIVAATSRPDMIDPAVLRPGRLDKHIYCPIPDQDDRLDILKVLSKDMTIEEMDSHLMHWSHRLDKFTGADIQSFLYSAQLNALHEIVGPSKFHSEDRQADKSDFEITVSQAHMEAAYEQMKQDVFARHEKLLYNYPPTIRKIDSPVAMRATLA